MTVSLYGLWPYTRASWNDFLFCLWWWCLNFISVFYCRVASKDSVIFRWHRIALGNKQAASGLRDFSWDEHTHLPSTRFHRWDLVAKVIFRGKLLTFLCGLLLLSHWDVSESRDIPGSSVNGIIPARILEWVAISSLCWGEGDLPDSGIKSMSSVSPAWQADSLPLSPPGSPSQLWLQRPQDVGRASAFVWRVQMNMTKMIDIQLRDCFIHEGFKHPLML